MKIELRIINNSADDTELLKNYIKEENLPGVIVNLKTTDTVDGSMSLEDYSNIIQLFLGSAATGAIINGIFDRIKNYYDLQKNKYATDAEVEKKKIEQSKVEFTLEKDGKKVSFNFSSFRDDERKHFFDSIDKYLKNDTNE